MSRIIVTARNEVGVIADISAALAEAGINIETIDTEGGVGERGIVVLSTNDDDRALHVLKDAGFRSITDDTLVLRLRDEPGALAKVAERFKQAGVNIHSLHILSRHDGYSMIALTADDRAQAEALVGNDAIL